jgi:hypothetical protein
MLMQAITLFGMGLMATLHPTRIMLFIQNQDGYPLQGVTVTVLKTTQLIRPNAWGGCLIDIPEGDQEVTVSISEPWYETTRQTIDLPPGRSVSRVS